MYKQFFKRFFDITLSGIALIVLFPVLIILAILIKLRLGSPVVFKQERPGLNGRIFCMYKFRTMIPPQTRDGRIITDTERLACIEKGIDVLTDEERLPKIGKFLRMTSLDELPELLNIFIGDMSIVGPRPLATIYLPYYNKNEMRRHEVRPGLTGLAQASGRNSVSWERRFEYDLEYIDNITLMKDLQILFRTVGIVLSHCDIGQGEERPESFCVMRQREWDTEKEKWINKTEGN